MAIKYGGGSDGEKTQLFLEYHEQVWPTWMGEFLFFGEGQQRSNILLLVQPFGQGISRGSTENLPLRRAIF